MMTKKTLQQNQQLIIEEVLLQQLTSQICFVDNKTPSRELATAYDYLMKRLKEVQNKLINS